MANSETVVYTPENGGTVPAWMAMNNGGLFGNGNGWGGGWSYKFGETVHQYLRT